MLPRTPAITPGSVSQGWDSQVRSGSAPVEHGGGHTFLHSCHPPLSEESVRLLMCAQRSFWAKMVSSLTCHLISSVALWQVVLTKPSSSGTLSWWQTKTVPRRGERTSVWGFGGKGRLSLCPWVSLELCLWVLACDSILAAVWVGFLWSTPEPCSSTRTSCVSLTPPTKSSWLCRCWTAPWRFSTSTL